MKAKNLMMTTAAGAALVGMFMFSACGKKAAIETAANNEEATAQNKEEADAVGNETQNIADAYAANQNAGYLRVGNNEIMEGSACVTATLDSATKTITVEFGKNTDGTYSNCMCNDGRNRRGKITVTYTGGNYKDSGSVKTVNLVEFYRNDNKVEGARVITNLGRNTAGNYHWSVQETNMKITRVDGKFHTWSSTRDREMLAGYNTYVWSDDEYQLTGNASGVNQNNINYTANITTPLHRLMSCKYIDKGVIEFSNDKGATRVIDYGNGTCDNQATVTVTGSRGRITTKTITLK
jgi:hypothetical protein